MGRIFEDKRKRGNKMTIDMFIGIVAISIYSFVIGFVIGYYAN